MKLTSHTFLKTLLVAILYAETYIASAQIFNDKTFKSAILNEDVPYSVYLPNGYQSGKEYALLVALHGFGGNHKKYNWLMEQLSERMNQGRFPDTVIIAPAGGKSWYIDDYQGRYRYASMFIEEFIPYLNANYKITLDRRQRAITGRSMGGFGALLYSMRHPEQFGICISEQAGISTKDQAISDEYFEKFHGGLYGDKLIGKERVNEHFLKNNPLYVAQEIDPQRLMKTRWYLQSPDDDFHSLPIAELHAEFHRKGVKHEYRVNDGKHGNKGTGDVEDRIDYLAKWLAEVSD